jgi:RNA recognition motif-containing protein
VSQFVYVGNLGFGVTPDDLTALCGRYGTVRSAHAFTDRRTGWSHGFAFVEMADGAEEAVLSLNGATFRGLVLTAAEAKTRSDVRGTREAMQTRAGQVATPR